MSDSTVFGGGQIEIFGFFRALIGKSLQARLQETFAHADGRATEERTGRILVSSSGWARFDVKQGSAPAFTFAYDLARGLLGGGLSEAPDTWTWSPWDAASRIGRSVPRTADDSPPRQEPVPQDAVLMEGVACRLLEYRDRGTTSRQWYAPELGCPVRIESTDPTGTHVFRIYDIRREEPDPAEWPTPRG